MKKNKKIAFSLLAVFFLSLPTQLSAQSKPLTKAAYQKQMRALLSQDTRVPSFNVSELEALHKVMQSQFISFNFPADFHKMDGKKMPTPLLLKFVAREYKKAVDNFELEEATGHKKSWHENVGATFVALYPALDAIRVAYTSKNLKNYQVALTEYKQISAKLETILKSPVMLSSKEIGELRTKNSQRRKTIQQKKIRELQKRGYSK